MREWSVGLAVVMAALMAAGCGGKAKEGDACQGGDPQCPDKHTLLECEDDGHYRAVPCPGPAGCVFDNTAATPTLLCDLKGSQSGDECPSMYQGFVICEDSSHGLVCGGDIWRTESCSTAPCQEGQGGVGSPEAAGQCN